MTDDTLVNTSAYVSPPPEFRMSRSMSSPVHPETLSFSTKPPELDESVNGTALTSHNDLPDHVEHDDRLSALNVVNDITASNSASNSDIGSTSKPLNTHTLATIDENANLSKQSLRSERLSVPTVTVTDPDLKSIEVETEESKSVSLKVAADMDAENEIKSQDVHATATKCLVS